MQPETNTAPASIGSDNPNGFRSEGEFHRLLEFEIRRSERSRRPVLLARIDLRGLCQTGNTRRHRELLAGAIGRSVRQVDIAGWYRADTEIGVIFVGARDTAQDVLLQRLRGRVESRMAPAASSCIRYTLNIYALPPRSVDHDGDTRQLDCGELASFVGGKAVRRSCDLARRSMDVVGSVVAIAMFLPAFVIVPILIKLTTSGPVFFRQTRLGMCGKPFVLLKFRSMYVDSSEAVHRTFSHGFITAKTASTGDTFKMRHDPRVTPLGRVLRRTSLDEIPQFFNVLKGEMSLVGPRPPIPYEVDKYQLWHLRRILCAKPGITGLWQVAGRSRTTFDEMVRMDIRYLSQRSLWYDAVLLLRTVVAVISAKGAY